MCVYKNHAFIYFLRPQYWPGSRAEQPILPSALRGGGMGTPPVYWQAGGGDLHI